MTTKIEVDVLQAVQDFYPGLSLFDANVIAENIARSWDYSQIYDAIQDDIEYYDNDYAIDLKGKDGVTEAEDNIHVLNSPKSTLFEDDT